MASEIPNRVINKNIITFNKILFIHENNIDSFPTIKAFYKRVFLGEIIFNLNIDSSFIFLNKTFFKVDSVIEHKEEIYHTILIESCKNILYYYINKEINKDIKLQKEIANRLSYNDYKNTYDIFNEFFNTNNKRVYKV